MKTNTYTLQAELEPTSTGNVALTLYAADKTGFLTGLMNCNKLSAYIDQTLLSEESSDPIVLTKKEAMWVVFAILEDWDSWDHFIKQDMEGQELG
jgi:hypothetical protein